MARSGARRAESKVLSSIRSQTVPASTAGDFSSILNNSNLHMAGIHANSSGTVVGTLVEDGSTVSLVVVQGMFYPYNFASTTSASTAEIVAMFN
jgi:hypothetical protein